MPEPINDPAEGASAIEIERWKLAFKKQAEQLEIYQNFMAGLFNLLMGQCTELLKDKIMACAEYDEINRAQNGILLLGLIEQITLTYDNNRRYKIEARDDFKSTYYSLEKEKCQSVADFYRIFKAHMSASNEIGMTLYDKVTLNEVAAAIAKGMSQLSRTRW